MIKFIAVIGVIALLVGRAMWIDEHLPGQWRTLLKNYEDTESIGTLVHETYLTIIGEHVGRVPLSLKEMNTIVYQWTDEYGQLNTSYQKPVGVDNVKEIRLGDLNYQIDRTMSKEDVKRLLNNDKD
ncbi:MAG: hypothetical protein V2I33_06175 [Kangiellaceae bacterium]|jgi:hypothetical protein|nr:hypothetical protein [Kangiellaceae bacterium]